MRIDPRNKLLAHLPALSELQVMGATSAPINVEIDLSNRCSLGCEWCHFAYTHTRGPLKGKRDKPAGAVGGGDLMDENLAWDIVSQLAVAGVRSVTWTGGGEPTLHPQFDQIVAFTWLLDSLEQGLYTHGGHIDQGRANLLKRAMTFVYVSLDAADREDYQTAKGVDRFDAACDGIRSLVAAEGDAAVGVGFLLNEKNWFKAREMATLGKELGADYVNFRPTIRYQQQNPGEPDDDMKWLVQPMRELLDGLAADPGIEIDVDRFRMYRDWKGHGYGICWWSALQTCITPNGKVWVCVNKREHPDAEIGDMTVESFADIWARHSVRDVDGSCRVMCRGHIPNLALKEIMAPREHEAFV